MDESGPTKRLRRSARTSTKTTADPSRKSLGVLQTSSRHDSNSDNVDSIPVQVEDSRTQVKQEAKVAGKYGSGLSFLEQQRLKNLKDNSSFLQKIELTENHVQIGPVIPPTRSENSIKSVERRAWRKAEPVEPRPRSQRLQGKTAPDYTASSFVVPDAYFLSPRVEREPEPKLYAGELQALEELTKNDELIKCFKYRAKSPLRLGKREGRDCGERVDILALKDGDVARVCQGRIYGVDMHPSSSRLLVASGDKFGNVGLWDVESDNGLYLTKPHTGAVRCVKFSSLDHSKLLTCSADGTGKVMDLCSAKFTSFLRHPEIDQFECLFSWLDPIPGTHTVAVAEHSGRVFLADTRSKNDSSDSSFLTIDNGIKPLRCVSAHPSGNYLAASDYLSVRIWDLRMVESKKKPKPVADLEHGKVCHGAFFSPISGDRLLTTCSDDRIRVFDTSTFGPGITTLANLYHDNHTGRWLAPFQATWHPQDESLFVIGCMESRRRVQVFSLDEDGGGGGLSARVCTELVGNDNICCRNVFHPSLNAMAGTTSSGKCYLWR